MIIDSSAVIAVLLSEADADFYTDFIKDTAELRMSAVSLLESAVVIGARKKEEGLSDLDDFIESSDVQIVPFDAEQLRLAREAWWTYGKGRHRARLNLGDCCSYALAKLTGEPLLYKGDDFARTDLTCIASPRLS
jgi:ribonuclease VapC